MKAKYLWVALFTLTFFGCDDSTGSLGLGMFPDSDQNLNGSSTTFQVRTESETSGAVYAKTSVGYVGKFTDNEFGGYEASFLAQLNCPDGISFPSVYDAVNNPKGIMAVDGIYAAEIVLYYGNYFGDSLNACRMSVYQLNDKELNIKDKIYQTDIKTEDYKGPLLARKAYTAVDLSLSDSTRNDKNFHPNVRLTLKKEIGDRIYQLNRDHPEYFKNSDAFIKNVFNGIYVKSDYGDGTVLYVDQINLNIAFQCHYKDSLGNNINQKDGKDSLYYMTRTFATTKEVIQANQFKNQDQGEQLEKVIADNPGATYLKSPAGIFTKGTLPINEIAAKLSNDSINSVKLTFTNYNQEITNQFSMKAPRYVLLLRKKDQNTFFVENKLADNITSYIAQQNSTNQYVFSNLTRLVTACLNEKAEAKKKDSSWNEVQWEAANLGWDEVVLIPVTIQYDNSSQTPNIISVQHDLQPGYVRLKGGDPNQDGHLLDLQVTYTNFTGGK